jgi:CubicO group peptidase (beta-lactamase class C family)
MKKHFLILVILIIYLLGCRVKNMEPTPTIANGWIVATSEEQGIDSSRLDQMTDVIENLDLPVDAVVVVRHGQLVFEAYPNPDYSSDDLHLLYSVTKSFTSALVGIAIENGFIKDVDQKVVDFFPEWTIKNLDHRKQALTIEHLLTMSCGFEWEGPDDNLHTWGEANRSGNPVKYVLDQPMASDPGTEWVYNGGCSHILSAILTKTTGLSTLGFARKYLFEPLGITEVRWPLDPQGIYYGGQDIWLTPRDMAKFGQLFLDNGFWEGQQIIPAEWVARSAENHMSNWVGGYGYQWWTFPQSEIFYASGAYEQRIYVIPELDMVVVFTANNKASGLKEGEMRSGTPMVDWLLGHFILPACDTYTPSKYDKFGFSLDIPVGMHGQELGKSWQGAASETSGLVQFHYGASPFETLGVQWDTIQTPPNLEVVIAEFSEELERVGTTINVRGEVVSTSKDDHELIYLTFEVIEAEYTYPGVIGAWYCDEANQVYVLYYATVLELKEEIDLLAKFQFYIDSFTCH